MEEMIQYPNIETFNAVSRTEQMLYTHNNIAVYISGGADSDIMLKIIQLALQNKRYDYNCNIHYVFFDTGIEMQATKKHLDYLEKEYNITIKRVRAVTPVPLGCKKYGVPFISKYVCEMIERLQRYNFDFANDGNKSYEELIKKYPKCQVATKWISNGNGENSRFNIERIVGLKEHLIQNPPKEKISNKCCKGAKKDVGNKYNIENNIDLSCIGIRKAENGIRSQNISSCFTPKSDKLCDMFRPVFWFTDEAKQQFDDFYNIQHSDAYKLYGLKRTGCAGCPFGSNFEEELKVLEKYEPKLLQAVNNVFGYSYEYTRLYRKNKKCYKSLDNKK